LTTINNMIYSSLIYICCLGRTY